MSAKLARRELEALENWIGLVPPGNDDVCTDIYRLIAHVRAQDEALARIAEIENCTAGHSSEVRQLAAIARAARMEE